MYLHLHVHVLYMKIHVPLVLALRCIHEWACLSRGSNLQDCLPAVFDSVNATAGGGGVQHDAGSTAECWTHLPVQGAGCSL